MIRRSVLALALVSTAVLAQYSAYCECGQDHQMEKVVASLCDNGNCQKQEEIKPQTAMLCDACGQDHKVEQMCDGGVCPQEIKPEVTNA